MGVLHFSPHPREQALRIGGINRIYAGLGPAFPPLSSETFDSVTCDQLNNHSQTSPMPRTRSQTEFARAQKSIPGGVNSPARAFGGVGGHPSLIDRGDGQYLYDIDGNRLIDYIGSWGPHILGHRHPAVIAAIESALQKGTSFGAPTVLESELAELVVAAVPSIEKVRMVNSGTEATMSAIRLARGFTGRNVIIKFAGCYHGHVDSLLVAAGSAALTLGTPTAPVSRQAVSPILWCCTTTMCLLWSRRSRSVARRSQRSSWSRSSATWGWSCRARLPRSGS